MKNFLKDYVKKQIRKTVLVRELEMDKDKLKNKNEILTNQVNKLKVINTNLGKDFSDLENENENLKTQIKNLDQEKQNLITRLESFYKPIIGIRGASVDEGKTALLKYILENINKNAKILDVGFGSGVYGKVLRAFNYRNIDGIDIYGDNIEKLGLDMIYDNIFIENILDFDFKYYDLIIMGDVLEHIELELAKNLLSKFIKGNKCGNIVVSIPYEYEQGEEYGNPYEKHLQPGVTQEYMKKHYPCLQLIDESLMNNNGIIAIYIWSKEN
jgi:2-polyprenyl-3-methyl-5-hydroxy-6-metoxy-1,4-benzoquinol methylase